MANWGRASRRTLQALRRDERGGVFVLSAVSLMVLLGFSALAVDGSMLYVTETRLQNTADLAAMAGASELPDESAAEASAIAYAQKNMPVAKYGTVLANTDVVTGTWEPETRTFASGETPANALRVTTRRSAANGNPVPLYLAWVLGMTQADVVAEAVATSLKGQPGCILALASGSSSDSLEFNSMSSADLHSCVPASNSTDSKAVVVNSVGTFHAGSVYSAGGFYPNSVSDLDLEEPAQTGQAPLPDPYAQVAEPSPGGCDYTNHEASGTIWPGVYCGGLKADGGSLTVQPGTYYIVDGDLFLNSLSSLTCACSASGSGVTFVITGSSPGKVEFNSIDSVSLQAPSAVSYPFPGMLLYVDRDTSFETVKFNSITSLTFNGAIYAPSQQLDFNSIDWTAQTDCAQIIGWRVRFNSIFDFGRSDNCQAYGAEDISIGPNGTRLVQ